MSHHAETRSPVPDIVPIGVWGGTPAGRPIMRLPAVALWVHHSVTIPTADAFADFRTVDRIHQQNLGGVAYSYLIHPNGMIGEGQGTNIGAHTLNWNDRSFGVCFIGNFMDVDPSPESISSFRWLRDDLASCGLLEAGIYPTGGHRDAPGNSTACPGNLLEAALPELRKPHQPQPSPTEDIMFIAVGRTVFGVSIAFLASGGRVLRTFNGPEGAYAIPQDALDWKAQPGRDAVPFIYVDPELVTVFLAPWPTSPGPAPEPGTLTPAQQAAVTAGIQSGQQLAAEF